MTLEQFQVSLTQSEPPAGLHPLLQALWYDANGNWERAHEVAQGREGVTDYDRLHAYLHRKEGDSFNAGYWYRRAKAPVFTKSLEAEWNELAVNWLKN